MTEEDDMKASLCIKKQTGPDAFEITVPLIEDFLKAQGVVKGLDKNAIEELSKTDRYEQFYVVAVGEPPTKGEDGYFEYTRNTQDITKKPLIKEDGTADYKNATTLAMIKEGELLATYIPPTDGKTGCDVFGNIRMSLGKGKPQLPLRGKGIVSDEDKTHFYAEHTGHIIMNGSHISIDKLYSLPGDLDIETGNIDFDGDVEVCGDARSGFDINASGNIYVHGHVGGCKLTAGGNITIGKGTQGHGDCFISAKGDVACRFVEWSDIRADGNIYADSVLNSTLVAKKQVIITSRTGNVIGGDVHGMTGLIVKEAGNDAATPTILRAGLPRQEFARASELGTLIKEANEKVTAIDANIKKLAAIPKEKLTDQLTQMKTSLTRARIMTISQRDTYAKELEAINARIKENDANSYVNVLGIVYEGADIYIGTTHSIIRERMREISYRLRKGQVVGGPIED